MLNNFRNRSTTIAALFFLVSCAKSESLTKSEEIDSTAYLSESVSESIRDSFHSDSITEPGVLLQSASGTAVQAPGFARAWRWCSMERFSPALGSASCTGTFEDRTVTSDLSYCGPGKWGHRFLSGSIEMSFDSAATCDVWIGGDEFPIQGSVLRTTKNFNRQTPGGATITRSTEPHENYRGQLIAGGVRTTFKESARSIDVLGIHRIRTSPKGKVIFDHSIYTSESIEVIGSRGERERKIAHATIHIDHNLKEFTTTANLHELTWKSDCCHPVEGEIEFTLSGSRSGKATVNFKTEACGSVRLVDLDGISRDVALTSCD